MGDVSSYNCNSRCKCRCKSCRCNHYTRAMFLDMMNSEGFSGRYNFIYLPIDFKSGANLGYAFVNLVSPTVVPEFWGTFDGFSQWVLPSHKVCEVKWSGP